MLYIRTDINNQIATGHLMRCIAIADAAKELGEETMFLLADSQAIDLLESKKYSYVVLNTHWNNMEEEINVLKLLIIEYDIRCMLIDSYQVTEKYLCELRKLTQIIYMADTFSFTYPVDGIICYANYYKKFAYKNNCISTNLYLGTEYVPLRKEFTMCPEKEIKDRVENLLLLSGGTDPLHFLKNLMGNLDTKRYQRIDIICGRYNEDYENLLQKYQNNSNISVHRAISNMKEYMEQADLVITAGGTTLYEMCAVGTPAISYAFADNQLDNVMQFQEDGIIDYAGDARMDNVVENVNSLLEKYYENRELRMKKSKKMRRVVDGKGATRIANILISKSVKSNVDMSKRGVVDGNKNEIR